MGLGLKVKSLYASQTRFVRRPGVAGELVIGDSPNIFQIIGGDILVTSFFGECMADSDSSATTLRLRITPTGGAVQVLGLACTTLTAANIGDTLTPTGAITAAMLIETTPGASVGNLATNQWILLPGIIDILVGGATDTLMFYDWHIGYVPLESGAIVYAL